MTVSDISRLRGLKDTTIFGHLEEALLAGETIPVEDLVPAAARRDITAAFSRLGYGDLTGVVESLGGKYGYGECRLMRAVLRLGTMRS